MTHTLKIRKSVGVAGQIRYNVTRITEHGEHKSAFVGSVYGTPGPITAIVMDGVQFHVAEPTRFGDIFNRKWVEAFYAN
jgi:hypothetical protein